MGRSVRSASVDLRRWVLLGLFSLPSRAQELPEAPSRPPDPSEARLYPSAVGEAQIEAPPQEAAPRVPAPIAALTIEAIQDAQAAVDAAIPERVGELRDVVGGAATGLVEGAVNLTGETLDALSPRGGAELVGGAAELVKSSTERAAESLRRGAPDGLGQLAESLADVGGAVTEALTDITGVQIRDAPPEPDPGRTAAVEASLTALIENQPLREGEVVLSRVMMVGGGDSPTEIQGSGALDPMVGMFSEIYGTSVARLASLAADLPAQQLFPDAPLVAGAQDVVAVGRLGRWDSSGVLVAPDMVLTAAHCLAPQAVLFGQRVDHPEGITPVVRRVTHPLGLDVAVLVLAVPVASRPREWRIDDPEPPSGELRAMGFGLVAGEEQRGAGVKHEVRMRTEGWGCEAGLVWALGCDPLAEMVVRMPTGEDTCEGDSGGPLLELHDGSWRLVGIVSRSVSDAKTLCGDGGVYVRVDVITPWLTKTIQQNSLYYQVRREP